MENLEKENKYLKAKEKVEERKRFYTNLISYAGFIIFLAFINYWSNKWSYPWFLWAAFGWGIGVVVQGVKIFGFNSFFGKDWEERKIKEFMNEDKKSERWK